MKEPQCFQIAIASTPASTGNKIARSKSWQPPMSDQNSSQPARTIADATIISRSPSVLIAEVDGEIVMMSIERGRYFGLDHIGSDIWKRIESPCSFATLIDGLAADYEAERAAIVTDVQSLLGHLAKHDLVRFR
jgi:hypothetical protein